MARVDLTRADLHTHSTASDGLDSPAALVRLASERGISVLAITDHDSIDGVAEAQRAGAALQVRVLAGVELSARARRGQTHVLGYGIDAEAPGLNRMLADLRRSRDERGLEIIDRLSALGIHIAHDQVTPDRPGGAVGRPHIARELVRIGAARSVQDAFDRYLAAGRPAFVPRWTVSPVEAVALIRDAGGIAVLAHPRSVYRLEELLPKLIEAGLAGLEAYYGEYDRIQREKLAKDASEYDLLVTGGSDYHGAPEAGGRVLGSVEWPVEYLNALLRRLQ